MTSEELGILVRKELSVFADDLRELHVEIGKAAAKGEADECDCIEKAAAMKADVETVGAVLAKLLDRIEALEKSSVRKHSIEGQEGEGARRAGDLRDAMLAAFRHPVNAR